jgi:hypothetical protein
LHVAGRIEELRRIGFGITTRKGPHGVAPYVLEHDPGERASATELPLIEQPPGSAASSFYDPFGPWA